MSKHTPGPWIAITADGDGNMDIVGEGKQLAIVMSESFRPAKANARLIAAAPELLEALKTLESTPDERSIHDISNEELAAWEKARAAIAKATGGQA